MGEQQVITKWIEENLKTDEDMEHLDMIRQLVAPNSAKEFFGSAPKFEKSPEAYGLLAELLILSIDEREKTHKRKRVPVRRKIGYFPDGRPCYMMDEKEIWVRKDVSNPEE